MPALHFPDAAADVAGLVWRAEPGAAFERAGRRGGGAYHARRVTGGDPLRRERGPHLSRGAVHPVCGATVAAAGAGGALSVDTGGDFGGGDGLSLGEPEPAFA